MEDQFFCGRRNVDAKTGITSDKRLAPCVYSGAPFAGQLQLVLKPEHVNVGTTVLAA